MSLTNIGTCPACGKVSNALGQMTGKEGLPEPGSLVICLYCGHPVIVSDDVTIFRELTAAEMLEIAADPEIQALEAKRREVMKKAKQ